MESIFGKSSVVTKINASSLYQMFLSTENLGKREEIVKIPKLHDVHPGLKKIKIMSYTRKQLSFLTVTISQ